MHKTFSVPSIESLKLLTIIEAEMDKNGKIIPLLLNYLLYRGSNQKLFIQFAIVK